ncbi:MAG: hypothetical protein KGL59_04480, partial [Acidobacteriota bacterium]|nr:hypothetical protein [Acidobacteriota bacterium]
ALMSVVLFAVGVYAACNKTSVFITTGQFPPGGSNIIITVSDPSVCAPPGGNFAHIYITITDIEASQEPTAEAHSSSLVDLTPGMAAQPVQVDLLGQPDTRCTLGMIAHGFAKPGTYKMLRVHLLATPSGATAHSALPPIAGGNSCNVSPVPTANCVIQTNGAVVPLGVMPGSFFDIGPDAMAGGELVVGPRGVTELNINIDGCNSLVPVVSQDSWGSYSFGASARAMVLDQAAAISGRLVDEETGGPIDGRAIVAIEQQDATGIDRIVMEATPDADGAFVLCPVPTGEYDLVAVAVKAAQTAYTPTVVLDVPAGATTGTIALLRAGTATTSTEPATLVGQVSLLAGTGRGFGQVRVSALAQTPSANSMVTFTVPLPQSTAGTISIAGPSAIPYSIRVPAANPRVAVYSGGRLNFRQDTGRRPSFTIEAQGCGSTKTTATPVSVTAGGTASAPILTINTCKPA